MDAMAVFGFFAFIMVLTLWSKVQRLERLLRGNGIRPVGSKDLARRLAGLTGRTVILTGYNHDRSAGGLVCRVGDTDAILSLVRAGEGEEREREMLIRLDDVKSVKEA